MSATLAAANLKGAAWMVLAMAGFAIEDMFLKTGARGLSVGLVIFFFGLFGTVIFSIWARLLGESIWHAAMVSQGMLYRAFFEIIGRVGFTLAIAFAPLSTVSAILQATPLVVVAGAAVLFGESVGWRRWLAIAVGLFGVMLILQPWNAALEPSLLFAIIGVIGFAGRDLATRAAPAVLTNRQLGICGFAVLIPTGIAVYIAGIGGNGGGVGANSLAWPSIGFVLIGAAFGVAAYSSLTSAMRMGEVAVVTPFRYTRLVFGVFLGIVVFKERPDAMMLIGSVIVLSAGLYTLWRQAATTPLKSQSP